MNGEIQQASSIVISARKALFKKEEIDFTPSRHVQTVQFCFAPKFRFFRTIQKNSVYEWFSFCLKRGLKDIKFLMPSNRENRHLLGFANTSQCAILCFWNDGRISCFCPFWEFDNKKEGWKVVYREQSINDHSILNDLQFTNKTDEFKTILLNIEKFATKIGFSDFSKIFHEAYAALCNSAEVTDDNIPNQLPKDMKAIYYAADKADVFGAMGSWNDSPSWWAQKKGMEKEYNELSGELLVQVRYHLLYVTNECWKRV